MLRFLFTLLLLLTSLTALAGQPPMAYRHSGDSLLKLYQELHFLYQTGAGIHQKYDETNLVDMKACKSMYGYNTTRAKATIGIANRLQSPNKQLYIDTGWQAYECVRCTGSPASCDEVPPVLKVIEEEFRAQQKQ